MGFREIMQREAAEREKQLQQNYGPSQNDSPKIRALKEQMLQKRRLDEENNRLKEGRANIARQAQRSINNAPEELSVNDYATKVAGNEDAYMQERMASGSVGADAVNAERIMENNVGSESGFGVDRVYMDATTQFSENFNKGVGTLLKGYGDIAQMVGGFTGMSDLMEGNAISKFLQRTGNEITAENDTYISPELMDPEFSFKTLFNPEFWLTHGAQFAPQIVEILATMGAGGAIAKGAKVGMTKGLSRYFAKELAESGVEKGVNQALRRGAMETGEEAIESTASKSAAEKLVGVTTNTSGKTAGTVSEIAGTGKGIGKLLRSDGTLSNVGEKVGGAIGDLSAGALTNLRVSTMNAGDAYNTYAQMKNENGEPLFTQEELAQIASNTFQNNAAYMGIDMLSWAFTFGGGRAALQKGMGDVLKSTAKDAGKVAQEKIGGALAAKTISPAIKKVLEFAKARGGKFKTTRFDKWATTAALEGLEESIQETHEEWSKMKGFQEATGGLHHYTGPGKKSPDSFWDFYMDKELEGTKTIASFLGAAAGGAFNLRTLVDKAADDAHKINTRAELFKKAIDKGTSDWVLQQDEYNAQVREMVYQGQEEYLEPFLQNGIENGVITEEKAAETRAYAQQAIENREKISLLNMEGKKAYYTNLMAEKTYADLKEEHENRYAIHRAELEEKFAGDPDEDLVDENGNPVEPTTQKGKAMKELQDQHDAKINSLENMVQLAKDNQKKLLAGAPAEPIEMNGGVYEGKTFFYNKNDKNLPVNQAEKEAEVDEMGRTILDATSAETIQEAAQKFKEATVNTAKKAGNAAKTVGAAIAGTVGNVMNNFPKTKAAVLEKFEKTKEFVSKVADVYNTEKERILAEREAAAAANPDAAVPATVADYKKSSVPVSEMTDLDLINSRTDEINSELERLKDVKTPEAENAMLELTEELSKIEQRVNELLNEESDEEQPGTEASSPAPEPEPQPEESSNANPSAVSDTESKEPISSEAIRGDINERLDELRGKTGDVSSDYRKQPVDPNAANSIEGVMEQRRRKGKKATKKKAEKNLAGRKPKAFIGPQFDTSPPIVMDKANFAVQPEDGKRTKKEVVAEVAAKAIVGGKHKLKSLFTRAKSFGMHIDKDAAKWKTLHSAIRSSERFSHNFLTHQEAINHSKLWNNVERPSVIFVHNMGMVAAQYGGTDEDYDVHGLYMPAINSIFISQASPDKDLTFHHEFLHYQYGHMSKTPEMREYLDEIMEKNPKLFEKVKKDYANTMLYTVPRYIAENRTMAENERTKGNLLEKFRFEITNEKYPGKTFNWLSEDLKKAVDIEANKRVKEEMDSDAVPMSVRQIASLYPEFSMEILQDLVKQGIFSVVPDRDQPVLMEELFVHSQEGARSKKYNMLFEEKAQLSAKQKFWNKQRARVDRVFPSVREKEDQASEMLTAKNYAEFTDLQGAVYNRVSELLPAGSMEYEIREQRIENLKKDYVEERDAIQKEMKELISPPAKVEEVEVSLGDTDSVKIAIPNSDSTLDPDGQTEVETDQEVEDNSDDIINEGFWSDASRDKALRSVMSKIKKAVSYYNKRVSEETAAMIKENNGVYIPTLVMDENRLEQEMFERAKDSDDVVDFIMQMRHSEVREVKRVMQFLKSGKGENSEVSLLKTYYYLNKSTHNTTPLITMIGEDGKVKIVNAKTSLTAAKTQQIMKRLEGYSKARRSVELQKFAENMEHIRTTPMAEIDPQVILDVLKYFGDKSIDYNRIMEYGFLNTPGRPIGIGTLLKSIAEQSVKGKFIYQKSSTQGGAGTIIPYDPDRHGIDYSEAVAGDVYGYRPRTDNVNRRTFNGRKYEGDPLPLNRYYRGMVDALQATNAQFTNSKSFRDANGNLTGARMMQNALLGNVERMSREILDVVKHTPTSRTAFINRYSHISSLYGENAKSNSNAWLGHIYDTVSKSGIPFQVSQSFGIQSVGDIYGKTLKDQTPEEDAINQLLLYNDRAHHKSKDNYFMMDMGRFAGSNRQFLTSVPLLRDLFYKSNSKSGKPYSLRKNNTTLAAYEIAKHQAEAKWTFEDFSNNLLAGLEEEIAYWENHREGMRPEIRDNIRMLASTDKNTLTPLTQEQKNEIANYYYNTTLNGLFANEVILPGFKFKENDSIKRAASASTTYTPLGSNVQNEIIYFDKFVTDELGNKKSDKLASDGVAYVLEEDLDRIKNATAGTMNINGHVKMAHVGVEHEGPDGMRGRSQYDKPLYVGLSEAIVQQNPGLRPLYEFMKARKAKYTQHIMETKNGNVPSMDYSDGSPNHIITAVSTHSNKVKDDIKNDWVIDIDNDLTSEKAEAVHHQYDSIYYPKNSFKGFSGENLGVQIVMNDNIKRSGLPSQFLSFITAGGNTFGNMADLSRAQQLIYEQMGDNITALEKVVETGDVNAITDFIKNENLVDTERMDQIAKMIIYDQNYNMAIPGARELLMNTLKKFIIDKGNRLSTPGTQARVVPSSFYQKQFTVDGKSYEIETLTEQEYIDQTTGDISKTSPAIKGSGLQHYRKVHVIENGKNSVRYEPGEMVAPANLRKSNVRSRAYFAAWDGNMSERGSAYRKAAQEARKRGLTEDDIRMFRLKGKTDNKASYGFYVPGDVVMATRIPSHGQQSTGFFEVVDFERSGASQVQVPNEFTEVTGGDFDGDALFINVKGGKKESKWNEAFDILQNHWLSNDAQERMVNQKLSFEQKTKEAIAVLPKKEDAQFDVVKHLYTPAGRRAQFNNTLISKNLIGSVMSLHRTYSILASHEIQFKEPISVGGKYNFTGFSDFYDGDTSDADSRTILSANIANMILDDIKHGYASQIGINTTTIKYVLPLINMGMSLPDVARIMTSPIMQKWVSMNADNSNMFTDNEYLNSDVLSKSVKDKLLSNPNQDMSGEIDFENITSGSSEAGILKLISQLSRIQNDTHKLGVMIRGHREMEGNAFIGQDQIKEFDAFLTNNTVDKFGNNDSMLVINDSMRNSPLVKNYRKNAELLVRLSRKTDIAFTPKNEKVWKETVSENPRNISDEKRRKLHGDMQKFMIAQGLGLSGVEMRNHVKSLFTPDTATNPNPKNIFTQIGKYMAQTIDPNEELSENSITNSDSVLFRKGLLINNYGSESSKYIQLNGVVANEEVSDEMRELLISEFDRLPKGLKRDLALYDLMVNGFNSRKSLFPLFSTDMKNDIQNALNFQLNTTGEFVSPESTQGFEDNFIAVNAKDFTVKTTNLFRMRKDGKPFLNRPKLKDPDNQRSFSAIENSLKQGNTVYVQNFYVDEKTQALKGINTFKISPMNASQMKSYHELRTGGTSLAAAGMNVVGEERMGGPEKASFFVMNSLDSRISEIPNRTKKDVTEAKFKMIIGDASAAPISPVFSNLGMEQRVRKENYYTAEEFMNREQFLSVMDLPLGVSEAKKDLLYDEYQEEYYRGNAKNDSISNEELKSMSDGELMKLYGGYTDSEGNFVKGVGMENKYGFAKIINRVTKEIANRAAHEQATLIRKTAQAQVAKNKNIDPDKAGVNFEIETNPDDISTISSWLQTSNIPSSHPALQAAVRMAKREEKIFKGEKAKYMNRLNEATAALYESKLGFNPYKGFKGKVLYAANQIRAFLNGESATDALYGNLIMDEVIEQDGKQIKVMRYKDDAVLRQELAEGRLSQQEWDFYETTMSITNEMKPYTAISPRGAREQYIPHVAPSLMEAYSRKGLLGVMVNLRNIDENLGDVKMKYNGKTMSYNEIVNENIAKYNAPEYRKNNSRKAAIELAKLKIKATKLLDKGINEDGTPIVYSELAMGSALGEVFMNEFTGERGIRASDLPSRDLNKAFGDFIHGSLFSNGNGTFGGFKKLLPLFDGIIANAHQNDHPNVAKYTEKVWRDYFLRGAKQHHTKTPAEMRALGVTSDNVIDYLTRASLFYWLGLKGLAIGGGIYAVGNVLAGKYANIRDQNGASWITGEKRFWFGTGVMSVTDPLAGLKQSLRIMKKAGFMDINIYDDLPLTKAGNFGTLLGDIALMPMVWSEKWIQGVQFLGQLTDEEYYSLANEPDYRVPAERMNVIESNVTLSQGRGYQPTDQRMIQMYSFGRMAVQFSRWIPTTIYNQFGKEDFDIYGQKYLGSYRAFGKTVMNLINGGISIENYKRYRESLTDSERERLDSTFRGFGLMLLAAGGVSLGYQQAEKLLSDVNIVAEPDRLQMKVIPPAVSMTMQLAGIR